MKMSNIIDNINSNQAFDDSTSTTTSSSSSSVVIDRKMRNVKLIYCGDGVVEECEEDDLERERLENEEKERQLEIQKQMDLEAVC